MELEFTRDYEVIARKDFTSLWAECLVQSREK